MRKMFLIGFLMLVSPLAAQDAGEVQDAWEVQVDGYLLKRNIEGSWELEVNPDPGPGAPPPFKALITFMSGGTCIETILLPPVVPAHGTWVRTGRNRFTFTVVHPLLDATGKHFATVRATSYVQVTDARELTATFEGNLYDPAGNVIGPLKGSETGRRITIE